jgi:hypothetical protein
VISKIRPEQKIKSQKTFFNRSCNNLCEVSIQSSGSYFVYDRLNLKYLNCHKVLRQKILKSLQLKGFLLGCEKDVGNSCVTLGKDKRKAAATASCGEKRTERNLS